MNPSPDRIEFRRNAVEPIECIKAGWNLVKGQYWLFVGMTAIGIIIGSVVPFGILLGPIMCGLYLALFQTRRGQAIEFGTLFKGFDYFGDSVVATLIHLIPIMVIFVPSYIIFYVGLIMIMPRQGEPDPGTMLGFFGLFALFWLVMMIIIIVLSVMFTFAYPLIVDRRLSGLNAVKLSIRAGLANFWRILGMLLLTGLLGFAGMLLCYVGVFLVMPISFAAIAAAYEQVFGLGEVQPNLPPPPPTFA
jgi:phage shock protein PspC (stress-responsive transcriptional regulator)